MISKSSGGQVSRVYGSMVPPSRPSSSKDAVPKQRGQTGTDEKNGRTFPQSPFFSLSQEQM